MKVDIEVATAELKNGIYEVNATREIDGIVNEGVHYISKAMLDWYGAYNWPHESLEWVYVNHTSEQLTEYYLQWYYRMSHTSVTLDKQYELIYQAKKGDILAYLLVDENLNIKEPYKLSVVDQHKVKYEAHFKEATKNEPLKF